MPWIPKYTITPKLLQTIRQIGEEIGYIRALRLPGSAQTKLQDLALQLSTHASTSIEGNPLALTDVRRLLKSQPDKVRDTEREILNYNAALKAGYADIKKGTFELTVSSICKIQKQVTDSLLDNPSHIGQLRKDPVIIRDPRNQGSVLFIPPDAKDVPALLNELISFTQENLGQMDTIILAGLFHRQHVIIHPFMDGNGRTTRILTTALLGLGGLEIFDLFAFENFYNRNVTRYFARVGVFGDYYEQTEQIEHTEWLEYFAEGILDELIRVRGLLKHEGPRLEAHHQKILDHIHEYGRITQRDYGTLTSRSLAARKKDFADLLDWELIERKGQGRSVFYVLSENA